MSDPVWIVMEQHPQTRAVNFHGPFHSDRMAHAFITSIAHHRHPDTAYVAQDLTPPEDTLSAVLDAINLEIQRRFISDPEEPDLGES